MHGRNVPKNLSFLMIYDMPINKALSSYPHTCLLCTIFVGGGGGGKVDVGESTMPIFFQI